MERTKYIALILSAITAFICMATSTGGNCWVKGGITTIGLWKACFYGKCQSFGPIFPSLFGTYEYPLWFKCVRAFTILGSIIMFGSTIIVVISRFTNRIKVYIASTMAGIAAGCMLIGLSAYASESI